MTFKKQRTIICYFIHCLGTEVMYTVLEMYLIFWQV